MKIAVIGAGHAGVDAAASAQKAGAEVVVFSNERMLPYFRPRLPSVAFGQLAPEEITMHPASWYSDRGIDLRLDAPVEAIDTATLTLTCRGSRDPFDALVLALGATPCTPCVAGLSANMPVFQLWSMKDACRIREQVAPGRRLVIIGGGILGLETALRAHEAGLEVTILERQSRMMPRQFGEEGSKVIQATIEALGIKVMTDVYVDSVSGRGDGIDLRMQGETEISADLLLFSIGAVPNDEMAASAGLETSHGIGVNQFLQTGAARIFAAGDASRLGGRTHCTVRNATAQGKLAGANAVAVLQGGAMQAHREQILPIFFKSPEIELHAAGVPASGALVEERLDDGSIHARYRVVVRDGGRIVGVQMIGTREGFEELAARVISG